MTRADINAMIAEQDGAGKTKILEPEYYDSAVIGYELTEDCVPALVYSFDKLVEALCEHDGMTVEDATEFITCDTMRAIPFLGDYRPRIVFRIEEFG